MTALARIGELWASRADPQAYTHYVASDIVSIIARMILYPYRIRGMFSGDNESMWLEDTSGCGTIGNIQLVAPNGEYRVEQVCVAPYGFAARYESGQVVCHAAHTHAQKLVTLPRGDYLCSSAECLYAVHPTGAMLTLTALKMPRYYRARTPKQYTIALRDEMLGAQLQHIYAEAMPYGRYFFRNTSSPNTLYEIAYNAVGDPHIVWRRAVLPADAIHRQWLIANTYHYIRPDNCTPIIVRDYVRCV